LGPIYTGDELVDAQRRQLLDHQLEISDRYNAGWSLWTYKYVGMQGLAYVKPDSAYLSRFGAFVARKKRLGADSWGSHPARTRSLLRKAGLIDDQHTCGGCYV